MTPPRVEFPGPSPGGMGEALAAGKARIRRKVTAACRELGSLEAELQSGRPEAAVCRDLRGKGLSVGPLARGTPG